MKTCTNRIPDNCDSYECGRPEVRAGRCEACLPATIAEARTRLRAMERATGEARARLRDLEGDTADHAKRLAEIEALAAIAATSPWTAWRLVRDHLPWLLAEHRAASEALAAAGIPDDGRGLAERVKQMAEERDRFKAAIVAANNVLAEVCHGDHEHQIECHTDTLPAQYRRVAAAAEQASKILAEVVMDLVEQGSQADASVAAETMARCARGEHRKAGESMSGSCADCGVDWGDLATEDEASTGIDEQVSARDVLLRAGMAPEQIDAISGPLTDLPARAPGACEHASVMPRFDEDAARGLDSGEVRKHWPRFFGACPACGDRVILYASWSHYISGDW